MAEAVTQQDFELFKQEMKHEYQLFLSNLDKKIESVINSRIDRVGKWVVTIVTIFILAFAGYFEYMRNALDRVNEDRVGRLERALLASMEVKVMDGVSATKEKNSKDQIQVKKTGKKRGSGGL